MALGNFCALPHQLAKISRTRNFRVIKRAPFIAQTEISEINSEVVGVLLSIKEKYFLSFQRDLFSIFIEETQDSQHFLRGLDVVVQCEIREEFSFMSNVTVVEKFERFVEAQTFVVSGECARGLSSRSMKIAEFE